MCLHHDPPSRVVCMLMSLVTSQLPMLPRLAHGHHAAVLFWLPGAGLPCLEESVAMTIRRSSGLRTAAYLPSAECRDRGDSGSGTQPSQVSLLTRGGYSEEILQ